MELHALSYVLLTYIHTYTAEKKQMHYVKERLVQAHPNNNTSTGAKGNTSTGAKGSSSGSGKGHSNKSKGNGGKGSAGGKKANVGDGGAPYVYGRSQSHDSVSSSHSDNDDDQYHSLP